MSVYVCGGRDILISIPYMVVFPVVNPRLLLALHVYVLMLSSTGVTLKSNSVAVPDCIC